MTFSYSGRLINHCELLAFVLLLLSHSLWTVGVIDFEMNNSMEDIFSRVVILNSSTATSKSMQCQRLWSSSIQNHVTCCNMLKRNSVKCLPSFIIAGVQKGGTTALSALLCTIDKISFSKKKEVHFFDNSRRYNAGITEYLNYFNEWDRTTFLGLNPPVFGESTPFYIASRDACRRISKTVPDVKIIVLLREPVKRAHSEYQMKKRRVVAQNEFIETATKHSRRLSYCLSTHLGRWRKIAACLPEAVAGHPHYEKLISMLKAKTRFKLSQRTSEPVRRLRKKRKDIIENHNSTKVARRLRRKAERSISASNSEDEKVIRGVFEWPLSSVEHCDYSSTCVAADDPACSMLTPSSDLNTCEAPPTLSYLHKPLCSVLHERVDREEAAGALWVRVLLGRLASERLPPTEESFGSELQDWMQCAGHLVGRGMTLQSLDQAVEKCLESGKGIRMGISKQFFYRSLYAVQLHNCFKYIPRDRFLIMSSESLQRKQTETFETVLRFLGLEIPKEVKMLKGAIENKGPGSKKRAAGQRTSPGNWSEALRLGLNQQEFIGAAVGKYFPSFESSSGWRLTSSYDPLPLALDRELQDFFKPYNELLYQLLGNRQLEADWAAG